MSPALLCWLTDCMFFWIFIFYLIIIFTLTLAVRQTRLLFILSCISECTPPECSSSVHQDGTHQLFNLLSYMYDASAWVCT